MGGPGRVWLTFAGCFVLGLAAMGLVTAVALQVDRAESQARRSAEIEERIRLALWRMDSALAPLLAEEGTRPYFAYKAYYPAERAYTRMFEPIEKDLVLVQSPLLGPPPPDILLHFQREPDGTIRSPQAPSGNERDRAQSDPIGCQVVEAGDLRLREFVSRIDPATLDDVLPPPALPPGLTASQAHWMASSQPKPGDDVSSLHQASPTAPARSAQVASPPAQSMGNSYGDFQRAQRDKNLAEYQSRNSQVTMSKGLNTPNIMTFICPEEALKVRIGPTAPIWRQGLLLLARRVVVNEVEYVQGCWLDWEALRSRLLASVADLLPDASLEPVTDEDAHVEEGRRLAALPVRLRMGEVPLPPPSSGGPSPIRIALGIAWGFVALAVVATAGLLWGSVRLSERRGVFVSAVTHELRTPLTTFRLYTEMLSEGMVAGEDRQRHYHEVLRGEADRLAHLVENVLAYARLERGSGEDRAREVPAADLAERVKGRVGLHAQRCGMTLILDVDPDLLAKPIRTDPSAIEQVLFNLVDNACKYANGQPDNRIHVEFGESGRFLTVAVRDHGPGVGRTARARLFRPFSKSARDAAHSIHGVGLGLALCRGLARRLGGDLRLGREQGAGASFLLTIPWATS